MECTRYILLICIHIHLNYCRYIFYNLLLVPIASKLSRNWTARRWSERLDEIIGNISLNNSLFTIPNTTGSHFWFLVCEDDEEDDEEEEEVEEEEKEKEEGGPKREWQSSVRRLISASEAR